MKPWTTLGRAEGPDGQPLTLQERDGVFSIRSGGHELMSSARHGSEEAMASAALDGLKSERPRVLIGGLGLGYTLRATLDRLPAGAAVVVAEISAPVVEWARRLAVLSGDALGDPRVSVEVAEVGALLAREKAPFDAVLLDVDNGPSALSRKGNQQLYGRNGLAAFRAALAPGGTLVVWSAGPEPRFLGKLAEAGFSARALEVPARAGSGVRHTLFVARRTAGAPPALREDRSRGGRPGGRRRR